MVFGSGAAPLIFQSFPMFSLAPRAPPLGDLAGTYPLSTRKPTRNFLPSVSCSVLGEYGVDLVLVVFGWFWFGVFRFQGVSAPGSLFFLVLPWKPFHKAKQYVQILKQARCIATEHTGAGLISSAARTILPSSSG